MGSLYDALLPVVLLIGAGYFAGHRRWLEPEGARQLATLGFSLLCPALLFRTMSRVSVDVGDLGAVLAYLGAEVLIFTVVAFTLGRSTQAVIFAMTSTFGNTVMIGIPLIGLAFGEAGLVYLFAVVSLHSVVMLTVVTVALEWLGRSGAGTRRPIRAALSALRQAILHPITLPILMGLAWGQTGWSLPPMLDRPLQWLGQAFSPVALLMVGITLAHIVTQQRSQAAAAPPVLAREQPRAIGPGDPGRLAQSPESHATQPFTDRSTLFRRAVWFTCLKNVLHPLLAGSLCLIFGLSGLPAAVIIVAAALPIGATVLMFAQRYRIARDQVTSAIAVSTFAALASLPVALTIARALQ
jgi:malonate transporter